jgi:SET family sugar efflux transporter-like MFS transporter
VTSKTRATTPAPNIPGKKPAARSLTWQAIPLASAIGVYGLTAAGWNTTMSLFLTNSVHVAPFLVGLFFTARAAAGIVAGLVTGWISDRMRDRRVVIGLTSVAGALGGLCLAVFRDYTVLLITVVVFTSIGSGAFGQLFAYSNELATARGRDITAFSSLMRSVFSAAYVIGAPLALSIMAASGFTPLYTGAAALMLVSAAIGRFGLRPAPRKPVPAADPGVIPEAAPESERAARARGGAWRGIRTAALPARLWLLLGVIVVLGLVNQMYNIDIALHVTKDLGRSAQLVGWMLGLTAALEIPSMIIGGRLARRVGSGRLVGLSALAGVVSFCLMPLAKSPAELLTVSVLFGLWQGVALSIPMVMVQNETPGGVGISSSLYGAAFGAAGLLAGAVAGGAASAVGYGGVLWVGAALSAVAAVLMAGRLAFPRPARA